MARLGKILLDGAALALVGVALGAAVSGYVGNMPDPAPVLAGQPVIWDDPAVTGSIAPPSGAPSGSTSAETASGAGDGRAWIDPPRRRARPAARGDG
ncbi:hypothetical protein Q8W71_06740 [Methylobacterium sp. NEAU 140]|uniref:hypothetical protein n=1 Tax=Methylobacterium sp. NEAU 140 TaxID=3064945 RepID=UPI002735FCBF|nr:hypothetical protein [Methylobacterium sp. NEAU 140]MDP4022313.1 hypothetical protein [Methylobacterium sp. NEAU 140]